MADRWPGLQADGTSSLLSSLAVLSPGAFIAQQQQHPVQHTQLIPIQHGQGAVGPMHPHNGDADDDQMDEEDDDDSDGEARRRTPHGGRIK